MRFVVLGSLLGIIGAVLGLTVLDLGWLAATGIWLLGGPLGALLAAAVKPAESSPAADIPTIEREAA